jgi:hypothetical protein
MHDVVLNATPQAVVEVQFFSISCDETTSINNQTWAKCACLRCAGLAHSFFFSFKESF